MRIQFEDATQTERLHDSAYMPEGYYVEPNDESVATVTQEVGEALLEATEYDVTDVTED